MVDNSVLTLGGPLTVGAGLFQLGATGALSFATGPGVVNVAGAARLQTFGTQTLDNLQINMGTITDLSGVAIASPNFVNNGQINVGRTYSYLAIDSVAGGPGYSTAGTGTITISGTSDTLEFIETQTFASGTVILAGTNASVAVVSPSTNAVGGPVPSPLTIGAGAVFNQTSGTASFVQCTPIVAGNPIVNNGAVNAAPSGGGIVLSAFSFVNNATFAVSNADHLLVQSMLTGTGVISLASGASAEFSVADVASVAGKFLDGAGDVLKIDTTANFASAIQGFATGDTLDLAGVLATGASWANNVLTVAETKGTHLALPSLDNYAGATFAVAREARLNAQLRATGATTTRSSARAAIPSIGTPA